jgi:hypothetical protein
MKKIISVLLVVLCVASVFCSCSSGESATNSVESEKHVVSDTVITEAFLSYRYDIGGFSMPLKKLLPQCCPDYTGSFGTYEGTKNEHMSADEMSELESGEYSKYLDNAYIVTIGGPIMENPDIPYLVTEEEVILKLLIVFDENDSVVGYSVIDECYQLQTCATLLMF